MANDVILVLDDDRANGMLQRRVLERAGYLVAVGHTSEEALSLVQRVAIDAVVVDYNLKEEITGLGFCARLRAAGYDIPVVLVSGVADAAALVDAMRLGVRDFVEKDLAFLDQLPSVVRRVLDRSHLETQLTGMYRSRVEGADLVLVLEDDEAAAAQQVRSLHRAGHNVRSVPTPADALALLRGQAVGVMVVDQRLSNGETGLHFFETVKSFGYSVPAILVTAFSDHATAASALRAGVSDYIEKSPTYLDELPRVVDRVFARARQETRAAESAALLSAIVGSARDAVMTIESGHMITLFNRAAEQIFQTSASEVLGASASQFLPEILTSGPGGPASALRPGRRETQARRRDGSPFSADVSITETNVLARAFHTVVIRDITAQKQAEAELRETNQRLSRTLEDLEQFAYISSHDLQEPLRTIMLFVSQLSSHLGTNLHPEAQKYMAYIVESAERMSALITDALQYAQSSGEQAECSRIDLEAVLGRVIDQCAALIRETDAVITHDALPIVHAPAAQIETVLRNLLTNAIKYRADRPPRVHLTASPAAEFWQISVCDNGRGFKPEYADLIFGVFKRLHGRDIPGTGIGLAVCKRIVENYGGRIWARSTPGEGATFSFTVPSKPPDAAGRGRVRS